MTMMPDHLQTDTQCFFSNSYKHLLEITGLLLLLDRQEQCSFNNNFIAALNLCIFIAF